MDMDSFRIVLMEIFSSPLALVIICAAVMIMCFDFLSRLVDEVYVKPLISAVVFGIFNGLMAAVIMQSRLAPLPVTAIVLTPLIVVLEFVVLSRDSVKTFVFIFVLLLMNYCAVYNIAMALAHLLLLNGNTSYILGGNTFRGAVYFISGLLALLLLCFIRFSGGFPFKTLNLLIHKKADSRLMRAYTAVSTLTLLLCSLIMSDVMLTYVDVGDINHRYYMEKLLLYLFALFISLLMLYVQDWQETSYSNASQLMDRLHVEESFRRNIQSRGMLSYCANITKNSIVEGVGTLRDSVRNSANDYNLFLQTFLGLCVHHEDWKFIYNDKSGSYMAFYTDMLKNSPSKNVTFRASPSGLLNMFNFSDADRAQIESVADSKDWIWAELHMTLSKEPATDDILCYVSMMNVDVKVAEGKKLEKAAKYDSLTGVYNRMTAVEEMRGKMEDDRNAGGALFLLDLDFFKQVNDSFGHPEGDRLLKDTAKHMRRIFRSEDVLGRLGGDEFFVYAAGLTDRKLIEEKASALEDSSRHNYLTDSGDIVSTSMSIGIAFYPEDADNHEELYHKADLALYRAKETGKGKYVFYSPDMKSSI